MASPAPASPAPASPAPGPRFAYFVSHVGGGMNIFNISVLNSPYLDQLFEAGQAQVHATPSIPVQMPTRALSAVKDYTTAYGHADALALFFRQLNVKSLLALLKAGHQLGSQSLIDEAFYNLSVKFLGAPPKYAPEDDLEVLTEIKNSFIQREYYL